MNSGWATRVPPPRTCIRACRLDGLGGGEPHWSPLLVAGASAGPPGPATDVTRTRGCSPRLEEGGVFCPSPIHSSCNGSPLVLLRGGGHAHLLSLDPRGLMAGDPQTMMLGSSLGHVQAGGLKCVCPAPQPPRALTMLSPNVQQERGLRPQIQHGSGCRQQTSLCPCVPGVWHRQAAENTDAAMQGKGRGQTGQQGLDGEAEWHQQSLRELVLKQANSLRESRRGNTFAMMKDALCSSALHSPFHDAHTLSVRQPGGQQVPGKQPKGGGRTGSTAAGGRVQSASRGEAHNSNIEGPQMLTGTTQ
ncbi:hypothetical protein CB1_000281007 [Camelus ferus]|nr:hypothetical protein CB1_000281007 [Camelus ferus]